MTIFRRDLPRVLLLALVVRLLAAWPQTQPNYMDAAYYTVGGQRLAQGYGFNDPYVWHYLDHPTGLPNPSHLYWMPLPSIMVAASQAIFGVNYRAAQVPFVLLSAVLPILAYLIAWQLSAKRRHAWLTALFTSFSPFYFPYWGVPESFTPFAVFGALALWLGSRDRPTGKQIVLAGVCAGLAHLSRADGFLLLIPLLINAELGLRSMDTQAARWTTRLRRFGAISIGYLLVMTPWFLRNFNVIGAPLSSAGTQMAWVCNYDELFNYGARLDVNHLFGCGLDRVVATKLNGLASGVVHLIAEDGAIFLAPLIVIGVWRTRRQPIVRAVLIDLALVFGLMMIVFTFAGDRGGLFHSTSALLPIFYAAAPIGLDATIGWVAARRHAWNVAAARSVFGVAAIVLTIGLAVSIYQGRVLGATWSDPVWNQADRVYETIGQWLRDRGEVDPIVMVNNPPTFTYHTGLRSIVVPNGDVDTLVAAAHQFAASWIVLDHNRTEPLAGLYAAPESDPRLHLRARFDGTYVLQVITP